MPTPPSGSVELDEKDLKILEILQKDNRTSQRAIGEKVHLSAPAVQRRIARLEESGVISSNVSIVNPEIAGPFLTIIVTVMLDSDKWHDKKRIEEAIRSERSVQQCYNVTGEIDYIMVVSVRHMKEYVQISRRLLLSLDYVRHFRSYVAVENVKVGLSIPLLLKE